MSKQFTAAQDHIPGGVNSPVRAFAGVGGDPVFIKRAHGAYIIGEDASDVTARQYIDYVGSWGPMILGHAHPEVIAAVRDAEFLAWLEYNSEAIMAREPAAISRVIKHSIVNKAEIVAEDERESGVRALLNFGHSFAHALETLTGYRQYLHGEAVAIGMLVASRLSERRELCNAGFSERLGKLLRSFDLPLDLPPELDSNDIIETMKLDKKVIAGSVRLILVKSAGQGIIDSRSEKSQIAAAISASKQ